MESGRSSQDSHQGFVYSPISPRTGQYDGNMHLWVWIIAASHQACVFLWSGSSVKPPAAGCRSQMSILRVRRFCPTYSRMSKYFPDKIIGTSVQWYIVWDPRPNCPIVSLSWALLPSPTFLNPLKSSSVKTNWDCKHLWSQKIQDDSPPLFWTRNAGPWNVFISGVRSLP